MLLLHPSLPVFALALAAASTPGPALSQTYRPDAEGYPCAKAKLAVVQDGHGFSIRKTPDHTGIEALAQEAADTATKALVKIGATLKLDQQIFKAEPRRLKEADDASRR